MQSLARAQRSPNLRSYLKIASFPGAPDSGPGPHPPTLMLYEPGEPGTANLRLLTQGVGTPMSSAQVQVWRTTRFSLRAVPTRQVFQEHHFAANLTPSPAQARLESSFHVRLATRTLHFDGSLLNFVELAIACFIKFHRGFFTQHVS